MLSQSQWLGINDLVLLINRNEDLKHMRRYFLDAVDLLLPYDRAAFYIFSEADDGRVTLTSPVCRNLTEEAVKEYEQLLNSDILARRVMNLRRTTAYRSSDLIEPAQGTKCAFLTTNEIYWYSGIIMVEQETLLGEVVFYRGKERPDFSDAELEILNVIKDHLTLRLGLKRSSELVQRPAISPLAGMGLTSRECEITELLARQFSVDEISDKLFISPYTTKKHINHIYGKLRVKNRMQLLEFVHQREAVREK